LPRRAGKADEHLGGPVLPRPRQRSIQFPDDAPGESDTPCLDQYLALKVRLELFEDEDRVAVAQERLNLVGWEGNGRCCAQDGDLILGQTRRR
jgi:hypothetical protein